MKYNVFQYGVDDHFIKGILEGASVAGHRVVGSEEWFSRRFEQNPLGKAVLACAFDEDRMVSCVAVERMPIQCEGKTLVGGCVHVLFFAKGYGTQDLWVDLLKVIEEECSRQGIDLLISDNNNVFIDSTVDYGWTYPERMVRYRFNSVTGLWRNIFKMLDMRKPFVADNKAEGVQNENLDVCVPDYFKWLIRTSGRRFVVVDNEEVCVVMVIGHRGKRVREAQICYFEPKKRVGDAQRSLVEYIKGHFTKEEIDVVSCVDSKNYLSKKNSFRVSQEVTYCYKWIGEYVEVEVPVISTLLFF